MLLVAVVIGIFWQNSSVQKVGDTDALVGYANIRETLPNETRVPLRLPTFIPFLGTAQNPVFSILEKKDLRNYKILLAWAKDCNGGNWCHLGSIQGSADPIPIDGYKVPISLGGGIRGYFVPSHCYAFCTEATIMWRQDGNHYAVGIKGGDEKTVLKMADSAVAVQLHVP